MEKRLKEQGSRVDKPPIFCYILRFVNAIEHFFFNDFAEEIMRVEHKVVTRTATRHPHSEDAYKVSRGSSKRFVVAVSDGHGKDECSEHASMLSRRVAKDLVHEYLARQDVSRFPEICAVVQRKIEHEFRKIPVGAVATCVVVTETGLTIAQVGDCVVMKFTPTAERFADRLTQDHSPDHPSEVVRLRAIYETGLFKPDIRVKGNYCITRLKCVKEGVGTMGPSRSFGDPDFCPAVISEPEVTSIDFISNDELYAICSDGGEDTVRSVFHRLKEEDVSMNEQFMETVERFAFEQMPIRPRDDITIVFFRVRRDEHAKENP